MGKWDLWRLRAGTVKKRLTDVIFKANKLLSGYKRYLLAFLLIPAVVLGYIGFYRQPVLLGQEPDMLEALYKTFQLFALKSGNFDPNNPYVLEIDIARWLALFFTAIATTAFLLFSFFSRQIDAVRMWLTRDHVIICGSGRIGSRLARDFKEKYKIVLIEQNPNSKTIAGLKYSGIKIVEGDAKDPAILKKAGVGRARYLIPALGDDSANVEVAIQARRLKLNNNHGLIARLIRAITSPLRRFTKWHARNLTCLIQIMDPLLCDMITLKEMENDADDTYTLEFFNLYENGARMILNEYPVFNEPMIKCDKAPHMLIIGLGSMGESLLLRAVKRWWNHYMATGERLDITVVDNHATEKIRSLRLRYPRLDKLCNIYYDDSDIHSADFSGARFFLMAEGKRPITAIFICLTDDSDGISTALMIHQRLGAHKVPIVVRLNSDDGMSSLVNEKTGDSEFENLFAFGLWDRTCSMDIKNGTYEVIAQAIHEEYFLQQKRKGTLAGSKDTMFPWDKLTEPEKEGNRNPARHLRVKMKSILCGLSRLTDWEADLFEFTPYEAIKLSILEHERWRKFNEENGWRHAPVAERDKKRKLHPDLVDWVDLKPESRKKDMESILNLPSILSRVDMQIYRKDIIRLTARALHKHKAWSDLLNADGDGVDDLWRKLNEPDRKSYLSTASAIKGALESCGYGISGMVSVDNRIAKIVPADISIIACAYHERLPDEAAASGGIITMPSWDSLTESERKAREGQVAAWPGILADAGMEIYHVARQMEAYKEELELLHEVRNAMKVPLVHAQNCSNKDG